MPAVLLASLLVLGGAVPPQIPVRGDTVAADFLPTVDDQVDIGADLLDHDHYDEAIQAFTAVLARSPNHGLALANRAMAYALTNRLAEARRDIDAAARAMPDAAVLHRVRAIIADRRSDTATELVEFSRSLEMEPHNGFALRFRAHLYQDAGNYEAALADADAYIAAHPQDPEGHVLKADLLIGQRAVGRAAAEAELLISLFTGRSRGPCVRRPYLRWTGESESRFGGHR